MSVTVLSAIYSGVFFLLMLVYGGKVCPFVDSLPIWTWASVLAVGYAAVHALRAGPGRLLVESAEPWERGRRQFRFELALAALLGSGIAVFDTLAFDFPLVSGLKVFCGIICFGFFQALDTTLHREMAVARQARQRRERVEPQLPFHSLTRRVTILASAWAAFNTVIIALVVLKDLDYLRGLPEELFHRHAVYVAVEILFVGLVLLGLTLRVLWSYARNLKLAFALQTEVLGRVGLGELDSFVPIISGDEFGRIARQTNSMIDGLIEKRRISTVFGKMVDPRVAGRLMDESGKGLTLGGERRELAVMITDIRDFTPRTEHAEPETVVEDLNRFFAAAVKTINDHGGMVDKFLGDGVLAVFGLGRMEDGTNGAEGDPLAEPPADCALSAARDLVRLVHGLDGEVTEPIRLGVGLHMGQVVAGLIGSPERLEFTVIGDVVNTASRLETLTKQIGTPIACSCRFREKIESAELRDALVSFGEHALKGKSEKVEVWGVAPSQEAKAPT